jgi:hypothetical protein
VRDDLGEELLREQRETSRQRQGDRALTAASTDGRTDFFRRRRFPIVLCMFPALFPVMLLAGLSLHSASVHAGELRQPIPGVTEVVFNARGRIEIR